MDDGEVELLDRDSGNSSNTLRAPVEPLLDDFSKNGRTCIHTHTCNPPGPDSAHTHTCYHTHTQVLPSEIDNRTRKPERPSGNRAAVRKYREKKKAQTAYLEEEVKKLRVVNQELISKLQKQAALEAEAMRLRSLLLDFKYKIDKELGVPPFYNHNGDGKSNALNNHDHGVKSMNTAMVVECGNGIPWFHPNSNATVIQDGNCNMAEDCQPPIINCQVISEVLRSDER